MNTLFFSSAPGVPHRVHAEPGGMNVDGVRVALQCEHAGAFVAAVDGRLERLYAVAHGDAVYVQLKGRAWRVARMDATRAARGSAADAAGAAGAVLAPMPGVVISVHTQVGQTVRQGDALLVIESMKLQMSIDAAADGVVVELPVAVGQSFQRGKTLVRTSIEGGKA